MKKLISTEYLKLYNDKDCLTLSHSDDISFTYTYELSYPINNLEPYIISISDDHNNHNKYTINFYYNITKIISSNLYNLKFNPYTYNYNLKYHYNNKNKINIIINYIQKIILQLSTKLHQ